MQENVETWEKKIILEKIQVPASKESLFNFIGFLDTECIRAVDDQTSFPYQVLARSTIALGYILVEEHHLETIIKTIKAGEKFALNPSTENWAEFFACATMSYPFGPGDGCFSIIEVEDVRDSSPCKPGSGCISGAGNLGCQGLDEAKVMKAIARELVQWILEANDPVISRLRK